MMGRMATCFWKKLEGPFLKTYDNFSFLIFFSSRKILDLGLTLRPHQVQGQPAWLEQGEDAQDPGRPLLLGVASWPPRARAQRHLHLLRAQHRMVLLRRQPRNRVESGQCAKKNSHFRHSISIRIVKTTQRQI